MRMNLGLPTISKLAVWLCVFLGFSFAGNDFTSSIYARCACLGEVLTFTCTVFDSGDGATVWSGSAFDCDGNEITLIHRNFDRGALGGCNDRAIIGESIGVSDNRTCFTSRLNATVSTGLNNKMVNCSNSGVGIRSIGSSTITIAAACGSVSPDVSLTNVGPELLEFSWSQVNSECSTVQYLITSDCGNCSGYVSDEPFATCSDLQLSNTMKNCSFSVTSMTRSFNGTPSTSLTVTLKVPGVPQIIDIIPVYSNNDAKALIKLIVVISQTDSFTIYGNISGDVVSYTIHKSLDDNSVISANCTDNVCNYMVDAVCPPSNDISLISVSAANRLGSGQPSEPVSLPCNNTFVTVDFNLAASTLTCVFQNKSSIVRTCAVEYDICDQEKESLKNEGNSSLESPSEVLLSLMLPSGSNCYVYRVTASDGINTVVVEGRAQDDQSGKRSSSTTIIIATVVPVFVLMVVLVTIVCCIACRKKK